MTTCNATPVADPLTPTMPLRQAKPANAALPRVMLESPSTTAPTDTGSQFVFPVPRATATATPASVPCMSNQAQQFHRARSGRDQETPGRYPSRVRCNAESRAVEMPRFMGWRSSGVGLPGLSPHTSADAGSSHPSTGESKREGYEKSDEIVLRAWPENRMGMILGTGRFHRGRSNPRHRADGRLHYVCPTHRSVS